MNKFQKDLIKVVEQAFNITDKQHKEVLKLFKKSRNNIKQFMADMYMKYGKDGVIDAGEFQRLHMSKFMDVAESESNEIAKKEGSILPVILGGALAFTYNRTAYNIEQSMGVGINFNLLRPEFINTTVNKNWSGVPFSQRIWKNRDNLVHGLRKELINGLINGDPIDRMAKRIDKQFNSGASVAQRLMRTEAARVIADAQDQIYNDSGVIQEVEFLATLDEKTSDFCEEHDGNRYRLDDDSKPDLPAHPNCRSTYIPVAFEGYKAKVRKDNQSKKIIEYQTYKEWAKDKGID